MEICFVCAYESLETTLNKCFNDCLFCTHETVESRNTLLKANGVVQANISLFNRKTLLKSYG